VLDLLVVQWHMQPALCWTGWHTCNHSLCCGGMGGRSLHNTNFQLRKCEMKVSLLKCMRFRSKFGYENFRVVSSHNVSLKAIVNVNNANCAQAYGDISGLAHSQLLFLIPTHLSVVYYQYICCKSLNLDSCQCLLFKNYSKKKSKVCLKLK
jgi:hypothetical protein